jgi:hypothetical protein
VVEEVCVGFGHCLFCEGYRPLRGL